MTAQQRRRRDPGANFIAALALAGAVSVDGDLPEAVIARVESLDPSVPA